MQDAPVKVMLVDDRSCCINIYAWILGKYRIMSKTRFLFSS